MTLPLLILKKRAQFVEMRDKGDKIVSPFFVVQYAFEKSDNPAISFGVTATKKIGNAVQRNRAKRRMRALMRQFHQDMDFNYSLKIVLIARYKLLDADYADLEEAFKKVLKTLNKAGNCGE